jgi:hypothetical protein
MKFKEATDVLFGRVEHAKLAKALSLSVASIRQARLSPRAKAYRAPPPAWQKSVIQLAQERIDQFRKLIESLKKNPS